MRGIMPEPRFERMKTFQEGDTVPFGAVREGMKVKVVPHTGSSLTGTVTKGITPDSRGRYFVLDSRAEVFESKVSRIVYHG